MFFLTNLILLTKIRFFDKFNIISALVYFRNYTFSNNSSLRTAIA
jgi:hypothetical protein